MKNLTRKTILLAIMAVFCLQASAQTEFIDKYAKNDKATVITIGKEMLTLLGGDLPSVGDMDIDDMGELVKKVDNIKLATINDQKTIGKVMKDVSKTVKKYNYSTVLTGKDEDIDIGIYFLQRDGKSNLIITGNEGKELNLIIMDGTFTMADLRNLTEMASGDDE